MTDEEHTQLRTFLSSLIIHAILLGALFFLMSREPEEGTQNTPIDLESIQTKQASRPRSRPRSSTQGATNSSSSNRGNSVSLADLGMRLNTQSGPSDYEPTHENSVPDGNDTSDILNPDPRVARFNQYVYNKVQGWLDRDAYMNPRTLTGTVKLKIWFDGDGNYLEEETLFEAIDPEFKEIVARALRKAFSTPIPRPYLYIREKFFIERMVRIRDH